MKVIHYTEVIQGQINVEGASKVTKRLLLGPQDGTPSFAMRMFEIQPGGHTSYHSHPFEHEVYILEGEGKFVTAEKTYILKEGMVIFVSPSVGHQFKADDNKKLRFLCMVPNHAA